MSGIEDDIEINSALVLTFNGEPTMVVSVDNQQPVLATSWFTVAHDTTGDQAIKRLVREGEIVLFDGRDEASSCEMLVFDNLLTLTGKAWVENGGVAVDTTCNPVDTGELGVMYKNDEAVAAIRESAQKPVPIMPGA